MQACFIVCLHIESASAREVPIALLGYSNVQDLPVCVNAKPVSRLLDVSVSVSAGSPMPTIVHQTLPPLIPQEGSESTSIFCRATSWW